MGHGDLLSTVLAHGVPLLECRVWVLQQPGASAGNAVSKVLGCSKLCLEGIPLHAFI